MDAFEASLDEMKKEKVFEESVMYVDFDIDVGWAV